MLNFCTLFDSFYLPRGLAMYKSLENSCADFHLYIFAFDDSSYSILQQLKFAKATIISLKEFENENLLRVKPTRSRAEYCWTCTPSTISYVIENYKTANCTYLDADLYFYQDPKILIDEMNGNSVLITEHRYPPKFNRTITSGIYCVQFMTFLNNTEGIKVLNWWRDACIEWCYDRYEDGKFGDQKYLDDWTTRFKGVHVLQNLGGGLASWNMEQYKYVSKNNSEIELMDKVKKHKFKIVFYHFHHVKFYKNNLVDLGWRMFEFNVVKNIYVPYFEALIACENEIKLISKDFNIPLTHLQLHNISGIRGLVKFALKKIYRFNVYNVKKLIAQKFS